MASGTATQPLASVKTLADLLKRLGDVPLERVRFHPFPGTATEQDVIPALSGVDGRLCELIDGTLVEKAVGSKEALLATFLAHRILAYLEKNDLGVVLGGDGLLRLWPGHVRIPDVSFISWDRMPAGEFPDEAIVTLAPDLAVEVLSRSNTPGEIKRKIKDCFKAGTRLFWVVDPARRSAQIYTKPRDPVQIDETGFLDGQDVLPGFRLSLSQLFAKTRKKRS